LSPCIGFCMQKRITWRVAGKRRLDEPRRPAAVAPHYDPEAFGRVSEGIARYFGTARYLVIQTVLVIVWIGVNAIWATERWDRTRSSCSTSRSRRRPPTPPR